MKINRTTKTESAARDILAFIRDGRPRTMTSPLSGRAYRVTAAGGEHIRWGWIKERGLDWGAIDAGSNRSGSYVTMGAMFTLK